MYKETIIKLLFTVLIIGIIFSNMEKKAEKRKEEHNNKNYSYSNSSYNNNYSSKTDDELAIKMYVKDIVKEKLKSPSTANFPSYSTWNVSKSGNTYSVSSYVDAENGFGAEIRTYFSVDVTISDGMMSYSNFKAY